ncbi:hypothetical protein WN943_015854 [Citrus x changshan-huyou]
MEQCSKKEIDNEEMKKIVVGCLMCLRCLTFLKLSVFAASTWQDLESGKMLTEIERHTKLRPEVLRRAVKFLKVHYACTMKSVWTMLELGKD